MADKPKVPKDLILPAWDPEKWKAEKAEDAIHHLFEYVTGGAVVTVGWYGRAKSRKALVSRGLRAVAIVLFVLGGLTPIVASLVGGGAADAAASNKLTLTVTQAGFAALGLAAGFLAFDRFFGMSSGWIRYMTSLGSIERLRAEFLFDWAKLLENTPAPIDTAHKLEFLVRAQAFQKAVFEVVDKETAAWVAEFQSSIADLEKAVQAQRQAADANAQAAVKQHEEYQERARKAAEEAALNKRPGSVNIEVTGTVGDTIEIFVDGTKVRENPGRSSTVSNLPPGLTPLEVRTVVGGKTLQASKIVEIKPAAVAEWKPTLP
jgi:hypothetical protein